MIGVIILLVILVVLAGAAVYVYRGGTAVLCGIPVLGGLVCKCPPGTVLDSGACWACPGGMQRTLDPASSATACSVPLAQSGAWCQTTTKNQASQADSDGNCVACPAGYARVGVVAWNDPAACNGDCTKLFRGGFENVVSGKCYACPAGMKRTADPNIDSGNACLGDCGKMYPESGSHTAGFQDSTSASDNSPTCWACPPGMTRSMAAVWGPNACGPSILDGTNSAIRLPNKPNSAATYMGSMTTAAVSGAKWKGGATKSSPVP